jgi:hypothetical protein
VAIASLFFEAICLFPSTSSILLELNALIDCTSSHEKHSRLVKNSTAAALSITSVNSASLRRSCVSQWTNSFRDFLPQAYLQSDEGLTREACRAKEWAAVVSVQK